LASKGYPFSFKKGLEITIKDKPLIFYAGAIMSEGTLVTNGGRVLSVVATGADTNKAYQNVYNEIRKVHFDNVYYRKDIGLN
jgi:phosphoribosylamine--glycine ligase